MVLLIFLWARPFRAHVFNIFLHVTLNTAWVGDEAS